MACRFGLALVGLLCIAQHGADAQQLQRLRVQGITLSTDTAHPRIDQAFNVTLTIRVAQRVKLENVYLPAFSGPEELGDIREQTTTARGTLYRETLALIAHAPGALQIGPGYIDAIDARDGRPKRFLSGVLQLRVAAPTVQGHAANRTVWEALAALLALMLCIILPRMRRGEHVAAIATAVPPAVPPPPQTNDLDEALRSLALNRDRASVLRLRMVLRHIAGAGATELLSVVFTLPAAGDEALRQMLLLAERAAFISDDQLPGAVDLIVGQRETSPT